MAIKIMDIKRINLPNDYENLSLYNFESTLEKELHNKFDGIFKTEKTSEEIKIFVSNFVFNFCNNLIYEKKIDPFFYDEMCFFSFEFNWKGN